MEIFLNKLHDALTLRQLVVDRVTLESENLKKLAANNIRLKSEYEQNQLQIQTLSNDVEVLHSQLESSRATLQKLKVSMEASLAHIDQIENINDSIFKLLLNEFKDNINDLDEINIDLNKRLDQIQNLLRDHQSNQIQLASEEIYTLKQNMRTRIDIILQRFNRYEKSFESANEEMRNAFSNLKNNISQEKLIIEKLESQLNQALRQLEEQRQKAQFFTAKQGQIKVIVSDFKTLFTHLETTFKPRLNFFSSYRGIKTKNLMSFIEILLANQRQLKANINSYRSKADFNRTIDELLNQSQVINCYHGLVNNSISKKVLTDIIDQFQRGTLLQTLKTQGIAYHDAYIKLNYDGELTYKNEHVPCPVQP
jgi:chromosome segregation ATPase